MIQLAKFKSCPSTSDSLVQDYGKAAFSKTDPPILYERAMSRHFGLGSSAGRSLRTFLGRRTTVVKRDRPSGEAKTL